MALPDAGAGATGGSGTGGAYCATTGWEGDEQCLALLLPELGFQLHFGPTNYDDPDDVAKYMLVPGDERSDCVFMKTPNPSEAYVRDYRVSMRPGITFASGYLETGSRPDSAGPEPCSVGPDVEYLFFTGQPGINLPEAGPENLGAAFFVPTGAQAAFRIQGMNTMDQPTLREAWANFAYVPASEVTSQMSSIQWFGGLGMNVDAHTIQIVAAPGQATCASGGDSRITELVGDTHANTTRLSVFIDRAQSGVTDLVYESYDWLQPLTARFDSAWSNPVPNPGTRTSGALSGVLALAPGDQIRWECEIDNFTDSFLVYEDKLVDGEMCNVFGRYAPSTGAPWRCMGF